MEKSVPHSASLVVPNGDPPEGFSYPTLTLMMDSYNPNHSKFGYVLFWKP